MKPLFALLLSLIVSSCSTQMPEPTGTTDATETKRKVTFRILNQGQTSGLSQKKFLTLRTANEFNQFWNIHTQINPAPRPKINFKQQMVIAVFMGEQHTGGYAIRINDIIEHEKLIQVNVVLTKPKPGSSRTMMITQPNMMVVVPHSKKTVIYQFWTNK